ncbi:SDR family NAD(P)-dependent oxidoreductase [Silvibacterium dinghuense]|uniref:SDR family oxidoreductase n=1 Tax=Silvibacterium dinghuense TaxID=1560006 RepID=A0A4Q1SH96_9BACT|nr:SDR family NAD(P)-dependent oxidoreductase [Silvibacterium dinghuense]RXS96703.1 SDR family oxidoreductase [Silvibacterium dinghuense]GGG92993.1 oxidoreductase [Silvibacterium dinghuense]
MDLGLKGKRALVTGSTAGIGLAIAKELAAEGATVWINGRTQARVDEALLQVKGDAKGVAADLATAEGAKKLFAEVKDIDILVNNLGIFETKPFLEIEDAEWLRFLETNVLSGVRVTRQYLPGMLERKWGRVLFISSESGIQIPEEMVHYGVTKAAQIALARGIAETIPGSGVTVNSLLPGPTESEGVTAMVAKIAKDKGITPEQVEKDFIRDARPSSLIKRLARVEEVAAMAVYLCSEQASATNGAPVRVDGGVVKSAY